MSEKRATTKDEREKKSNLILNSAKTLFLEKEYEKIGMLEIARHARIAKGTLYLYFNSKESVFLTIMTREFADWFSTITSLISTQQHLNIDKLSTVIIKSLDGREAFTRLLLLQSTVLEKNVSFEVMKKFKTSLRDSLLPACKLLSERMDCLKESDALDFFIWLYAMVIGLKSLSDPCSVAQEVLEKENLTFFQIDFIPALKKYITSYLEGIRKKSQGVQNAKTEP